MSKRLAALYLAVFAWSPTLAQPAAAPPPAAPPAAAHDLASKQINAAETNWNVYGPGQTNKRLETGGPQNYPAVHVEVTQKGKNPWDVGAISPVAKPIAAGDTLLIAVYLRAPNARDGETVPLPFVGLTGSSAPYATLISEPLSITNQWKQYFVKGRSAQAAAAGGAQASVHLAGDVHVIELGPMRIFDFGPDVDPARLPKNQ